MKLRVIAFAGALLASAPRLCLADDAPDTPGGAGAQLSWVRGPGADACADRTTLAGEVSRRLGRDPFAGEPTRWLEATVFREENHWVVRIYVRDSAGALLGERALQSDSPTCEPISAAASLALAIAIDPDAALRPPPAPPAASLALVPAPPPLPPPPAPPTGSIAPTLVSRSDPPRPRPVRPVPARARSEALVPPASPPPLLGASARFAGTLGLLPEFAPGIEIESTVLSLGWFRASLGVVFFPEVRTSVPDHNFAFGFTAAWLRGCAAVVRAPRAELLACGGSAVGAVHSVVYVRQPTGPGDRPWFGFSAGLRTRVRIVGPLSLDASLEALVPVTRYEFDVVGRVDPVFTQSPIAGVAQLGLSLSIW